MRSLLAPLLVITLMILLPLGWVMNIVKFCKSDFAEPYKTEVIRGAGIFMVPIGIIVGYMDIGEENEKEEESESE